jgi:hypothetical protein
VDYKYFSCIWDRSIYEKLVCSYCIENNKAFTLMIGGKTSVFYCHSRFLSNHHQYKYIYIYKGLRKAEMDVALPILNCMILYPSMRTLYLIFNSASKSFLIFCYPQLSKTKDNIKDRMNVILFCDHDNFNEWLL